MANRTDHPSKANLSLSSFPCLNICRQTVENLLDLPKAGRTSAQYSQSQVLEPLSAPHQPTTFHPIPNPRHRTYPHRTMARCIQGWLGTGQSVVFAAGIPTYSAGSGDCSCRVGEKGVNEEVLYTVERQHQAQGDGGHADLRSYPVRFVMCSPALSSIVVKRFYPPI